jgi:hypothetical protein
VGKGRGPRALLEDGAGGGLSLTGHTHGLIRGSLAHERSQRKEVMAKTFSIETTVAPSSLLARARRMASDNGATLVGDEGSGRFSHEMVRGKYRTLGRTVIVTITDKHWLLPWPVVEARLRELVR